MKFKDGRVYEGDWVKDRMQGVGSFKWPTGQQYVGEYSEDQKHGKGRLTYSNG